MINIEAKNLIGNMIQSIDVECLTVVKIYFTDGSMIMIPKRLSEPVIYRNNRSIYELV